MPDGVTDKDGIVTAAAVSSLGGLNSFLSTNHDMLRLYQVRVAPAARSIRDLVVSGRYQKHPLECP